ncbi:MAG: hypothetical protein HY424_00995 [Candidatus Levybacteria bacterium]|nr:hypothetical protein [Candidatus Levybacteria bacterium]
MGKEQLYQYNIGFDQREKDQKFITKQIETHLKERFNVLLSTVYYEVANGHLVRQGVTEPFINSIRRGRDLIQRVSPNTVDIERENAEVTGFGDIIDPFLSSPKTPVGSKVLSISPKGEEGSKYQHNFYDIFTLKETEGGRRYVELSRYSSALSPKEYAERLSLNSNNPPNAAAFLTHPILVKDFSITAEQIHQALHRHHDYMSLSEFGEIWKDVESSYFIEQYLANRDALSFNAVLNYADEVWKNNNKRKRGETYKDYTHYSPSYEERRAFEEKKVRQAAGGCPGKSGADAPFSVSEFANLEPDKYGSRTFTCPACGETNVRPKDELLEKCQHCGGEVACK